MQATHAAIQFAFEHPTLTQNWYQNSNYLAQLSVSNEEELLILAEKFKVYGVAYSIFREPDIDNQVTAIAVEPHPKTRKLTSHLPLMLKEYHTNKICKNNKERSNYVVD